MTACYFDKQTNECREPEMIYVYIYSDLGMEYYSGPELVNLIIVNCLSLVVRPG